MHYQVDMYIVLGLTASSVQTLLINDLCAIIR